MWSSAVSLRMADILLEEEGRKEREEMLAVEGQPASVPTHSSSFSPQRRPFLTTILSF